MKFKKKIKFKKRYVVFAIIGLIIFNIIKGIVFPDKNKDALVVDFEKIKKEELVSKVSISGTIDSESKDIKISSGNQKVGKYLIKEGDVVKKGQRLFMSDTRELNKVNYELKDAKIQLTQAELELEELKLKKNESNIVVNSSTTKLNNDLSELESTYSEYVTTTTNSLSISKKNMEDAKKALIENEVLFKNGGLSQFEINEERKKTDKIINDYNSEQMQFDNKKVTYENSIKNLKEQVNADVYKNSSTKLSNDNSIKTKLNNIESLKLKYEEAKLNYNNFLENEKSKIDGVVVRIYKQENENVVVGDKILEIADTTKLCIKSDVSEYNSTIVRSGQQVKITTDKFQGENWDGVVKQISPMVFKKILKTKEETVAETLITINNSKDKLKLGYEVEAEIIIDKKSNVLTAPILAVFKDKDNKEYVFVKNGSKLKKKFIKTGIASDLSIEVIGLKENEEVAVNVSSDVEDGTAIKTEEI